MTNKASNPDVIRIIKEVYHAIDDYLKVGGSNERHRLWVQKEILRAKLIVSYDQTLEKEKGGKR